MRAAALLATSLAGCLVLNPAYDPGADSAGGSGTTSASAGASTGASAFDESSAGGGQSAGGSTGVDETTTGAPTTGGASAGSTGVQTTTGAGCEACGECETCEAGQCVAKRAGSACEIGEDLPCEQRIWGYVSDGCAVMKASAAAACDAGGTCLWQCDDVPGAVPFKCEELCYPEQSKCSNGTDVATVALADVCVTGGPSSTCTDQCVEVQRDKFATEPRACDKDGKCKPSGVAAPCGAYACQPSGDACEDSCSSDVQCAGGAECDKMAGKCVGMP